MHSVLHDDTRAVYLCVDWLRDGTYNEEQSAALRDGLQSLTTLEFSTDAEWVNWYFEGGGQQDYPEPDFRAWQNEENGGKC